MWVIEKTMRGDDGADLGPIYLRGERRGGQWTDDIEQAWQFAREQDAEHGIKWRLTGRGGVRVVEHEAAEPEAAAA